jgi:FAD/FMN-containing dehydrogenase
VTSRSDIVERQAIDLSALRELRQRTRGELIEPADASYESARKVWNGNIDKQPALIVRCSGVADVLSCVDFAHEQQLVTAVRGGGHNVAGNSVCEDGLVIDLSLMRTVRVDATRRTATAGGGATWGDFDHESTAFGLATTGGVIPTTGIAGLTLGGGVGWLMRKHGLTCDNLIGADLVTAQGLLVHVSEEDNPELLWGLRGGGGNFGIVTTFEYRLHPVDDVLVGIFIYLPDSLAESMKFYREYSAKQPDELTSFLLYETLPSVEVIPGEIRGREAVVIAACYAGDAKSGESALRPLSEFASPLATIVASMPYLQLQHALDDFPAHSPGGQNYWKAEYLHELSDDEIDALAERAAEVTSPLSYFEIGRMGGAISRFDPQATAVGHRDADYLSIAAAVWSAGEKPDRHVAWARQVGEALQASSAGGGYVNYLGAEGEERVRQAYGTDTYERLVVLKRKYDPENFFALNQNIRP